MLMQAVFFGRWQATGAASKDVHERGALRAFSVIATLTMGWLAYAEYYPISSWKMYSGRRTSTEVTYNLV